MSLFDPTWPKSSLLSNNTLQPLGSQHPSGTADFVASPAVFPVPPNPSTACTEESGTTPQLLETAAGIFTQMRLGGLTSADYCRGHLQGTLLGTNIHVPDHQQAQRGVTPLILRVTAMETKPPSSWDHSSNFTCRHAAYCLGQYSSAPEILVQTLGGV